MWCADCPWFGWWSPVNCPILLWALPGFLTWDVEAYLDFPCSSSEISHFSKESLFLLVENGIQSFELAFYVCPATGCRCFSHIDGMKSQVWTDFSLHDPAPGGSSLSSSIPYHPSHHTRGTGSHSWSVPYRLSIHISHNHFRSGISMCLWKSARPTSLQGLLAFIFRLRLYSQKLSPQVAGICPFSLQCASMTSLKHSRIHFF